MLALAYLAIFASTLWQARRAPLGYEDATGFHYGTPRSSKLLLCLALCAMAIPARAAAPAPLPPVLRGWEHVLAGEDTRLPRYFRYKRTGGIFLGSPDTPATRRAWMLARQADGVVVGFGRTLQRGAPNQLAGPCVLRAMVTLAGLRGQPDPARYAVALARSPRNGGHAFIVRTAPDGTRTALDSAESVPEQPLRSYLAAHDLTISQEVPAVLSR